MPKKPRTEKQLKNDKENLTCRYITSENANALREKGLEVRRQNKEMRETLQTTMDMLLRKTIKKGAKVDAEDFLSIAEAAGQNISVQQAMALAQIQKALSGDTTAAVFIRDTLGEKPVDRVETGITIEDYVKEHKVKF